MLLPDKFKDTPAQRSKPLSPLLTNLLGIGHSNSNTALMVMLTADKLELFASRHDEKLYSRLTL
jgi:hypothetical protein